MLQVDLQLLPRCGQVVGQEHVCGLGDLVDQRLSFGRRDIDADRALAAIGMLDHRVAVRIDLDPAHVDETALRVAAHGMLDLDDVGAPSASTAPADGTKVNCATSSTRIPFIT